MAKKKFPYVLIKDAKNGFRVHFVGGNGEKLMTSEVLECVQAVKKNIAACRVAIIGKSSQYIFPMKDVMTWVVDMNIRYEGKSDAIYKTFEIEKPNNNQ